MLVTQRKILLTEGSSTSARQTLYALGGRHTIDVLDPNPLCQCRFSRFVRRWIRCPSYSQEPKEYLKFVAQQIRDEGYDVLLPTHEQVYLLARVRDELREQVGIALPEFDVINRVQGKADFCRLLGELGLPQPATRIISTREELLATNELPCFVKLSHSTAGTGVFRVGGMNELQQLADEFDEAGQLNGEAELLVQQPAKGVLSIFQTVFQHGRLVGWHGGQTRRQGVGGAPIARVSAKHEGVVDDVERLGKHLNWHGAIFFEYFFDEETEKCQFLEANPRIGETLNATLSGANLCEQLVRVAMDEEVEPLDAGKLGVRSHQGFMALMALGMNGGTRRQLIWEILRGKFRCEPYRNSHDELTRLWSDWLSVIPAAAITMQLLASPALAKRIVAKTVENYSLPDEAARKIRDLPREDLVSVLSAMDC